MSSGLPLMPWLSWNVAVLLFLVSTSLSAFKLPKRQKGGQGTRNTFCYPSFSPQRPDKHPSGTRFLKVNRTENIGVISSCLII
jgi:hypothetical protein